MGLNILYVYFDNQMEKEAKALRPEGEVAASSTFLNSINMRVKGIDTLHLIAHANWIQFHDYSANQLSQLLIPFFQKNPQIRNLTLNGCYTGNRDQLPHNTPNAFCKTVAIDLKQILPYHEYLEIIGFTGPVFVGIDGYNKVWNVPLSDADEKTFNKLTDKREIFNAYKNRIKPEFEATIKWFFSKNYQTVYSDPETPSPPSSPNRNNNTFFQ